MHPPSAIQKMMASAFAGIDLRLRIFCKLDWLRFLLASTWCRFRASFRISLRATYLQVPGPSVHHDLCNWMSKRCHYRHHLAIPVHWWMFFEVPGLLGITLPFSSDVANTLLIPSLPVLSDVFSICVIFTLFGVHGIPRRYVNCLCTYNRHTLVATIHCAACESLRALACFLRVGRLNVVIYLINDFIPNCLPLHCRYRAAFLVNFA